MKDKFTQKFLERYIPKKYWERVSKIELESDLIDDCKYMLYFENGYAYQGDYWCLPVKNIKEAIEFIKDSWKEEK